MHTIGKMSGSFELILLCWKYKSNKNKIKFGCIENVLYGL